MFSLCVVVCLSHRGTQAGSTHTHHRRRESACRPHCDPRHPTSGEIGNGHPPGPVPLQFFHFNGIGIPYIKMDRFYTARNQLCLPKYTAISRRMRSSNFCPMMEEKSWVESDESFPQKQPNGNVRVSNATKKPSLSIHTISILLSLSLSPGPDCLTAVPLKKVTLNESAALKSRGTAAQESWPK